MHGILRDATAHRVSASMLPQKGVVQIRRKMDMAKTNAQATRLQKTGEVIGLAGRALVAAGLGAPILKFALASVITVHLTAIIIAGIGLFMVFGGIQLQSIESKESDD